MTDIQHWPAGSPILSPDGAEIWARLRKDTTASAGLHLIVNLAPRPPAVLYQGGAASTETELHRVDIWLAHRLPDRTYLAFRPMDDATRVALFDELARGSSIFMPPQTEPGTSWAGLAAAFDLIKARFPELFDSIYGAGLTQRHAMCQARAEGGEK